jgi:hypothetical protein
MYFFVLFPALDVKKGDFALKAHKKGRAKQARPSKQL